MTTNLDDQPNPRRRGFRFSLKTILLLTVVAAIGFSLWTSSQRHQENRRLQAEIKRLRSELGELTIEDGQEHKLHAIGIPTLEPMTWKWRVYAPEGRDYRINTWRGAVESHGELPGDGLSRTSSGTFLSGESVVTAAVIRNHLDEWTWVVKHKAGSSQVGVSPTLAKLISAGAYSSTTSGVDRTQKSIDQGEPLELFRHRVFESGISASSDPIDGFVIWIE